MKKIIYLSLTALVFFGGCQKAEIPLFETEDGIYFNTTGTTADSTSYTFAIAFPPIDQDTLFINMRVLGGAKDYDRPISLEILPGTTAAPDTEFKLTDAAIPAGAVTVRYPVLLFKTARLKTETARIVLRIKENEHFTQGIGNRLQYIVDFNDQIIRPDWWAFVQSYFGAYSAAKYGFMIQVFGITDFRSVPAGGTIPYGEMFNYQLKARQELAEYEAINGPLIDENGVRVTF